MPQEQFEEATLVRVALPVAAWLLEHKHTSWPTSVGLILMGSTMIWLPWWARLMCIAGMGIALLGIELENLAHRIDGADTMMFLMTEAQTSNERKRS